MESCNECRDRFERKNVIQREEEAGMKENMICNNITDLRQASIYIYAYAQGVGKWSQA